MPLITPTEALALTVAETAALAKLEDAFNDALRAYEGGELVVTVDVPSRLRPELTRRLDIAGWTARYETGNQRDGAFWRVRAKPEPSVMEPRPFRCVRCCDTGVIETGNNDLPCDCAAGDKALFSIGGVSLTGNDVWRSMRRP